MKAEINEDDKLVLEAESSTENYALKMWIECYESQLEDLIIKLEYEK